MARRKWEFDLLEITAWDDAVEGAVLTVTDGFEHIALCPMSFIVWDWKNWDVFMFNAYVHVGWNISGLQLSIGDWSVIGA